MKRRTGHIRAAAIVLGLGLPLLGCSSESMSSIADGDLGSVTLPSAADVTMVDDSVLERAGAAADALRDGNFSAMLQALNLSGVADEIEGRKVTILAPSDDSFTQLSGTDAAGLVADRSRVDDLVRGHILDDLYTYEQLAAKDEVKTIDGHKLTVASAPGVITVDGATVRPPAASELQGKNGQEVSVLRIDRVLVPDA